MTAKARAAEGLLKWLSAHGLAQYHRVMADEDITLDALEELDDTDLKELGFSIGHRKVLRRALAAEAKAETVGEAANTPAAPADVDQGQRRQLTVVFCDLAGSTRLARTYDAEDMAQILHRYHDACYKIIQKWGGKPLGTQGDGVIACFGLPQAQENDAERCVRAALEMSAAISALEFEDGLKLDSRIGVATGRLFVRGAVEEPGNVVGDTLNLASRLQDAAAFNTVVISASTRRLIEKVARLSPLGQHDLKGFTDPVEIWTVEGMYEIADRLAETGGGPSLGLIGRQHEIDTLNRLWDLAKSGKGQVVSISGDAGIGKSYVLEALRSIVEQDDHVHIRYFSAPFYENSALFPVIAQLNHAAGIGESDDNATRLAKVAKLAPGADDTQMRLFADLMSIDAAGAWPPLDMTAAQQKLETFAALQSQLLDHAKDRPVLILAEDAHWADPTSLEFLTTVVTSVVPNNRVLLVVTHRPTRDLGWAEQDHLHRLTLDRLTPEQSRAIVLRVMGDIPCPPELMHDIVENADGVPLFVEELARSVAEQIAENGLGQVRLPSSLEDSLRGRLDRLSLGKKVIQTAAVFGRRFYLSTLRPLLDMPDTALSHAVQEPVDAKIIVPVDDSTSETMLFRHALVQQAAYEGLLRKQRSELHAQIAALLLEHNPTMAETEPETLARHFAGSGQFDAAIKFLIAAGQRATSRAAQIEATNHYQAALDLLNELPPSPARDSQEVLLQALLGGALMATRGFAAPDCYNAFARARALCVELGDNPMYCACLYGLFTVNASRSNKAEAVALADEMLETFGAAPVPSWAIAAQFSSGVARFFLGEMDAAKTHFEKAVALYTDDQHGPLVEQFGDDLAEFSLCYLHWLYLQQGQVDLSERTLSRAEKMANDLNNKNAQTRSIAFRMGRLQELEDVASVAEIAPKVIGISMQQGYPYWATAGQIGLGWVTALSGDESGTSMIEEGLAFFDMIGQKTPQTYWRTYLVAGLIKANRRADAIAAADYALAQSEGGLDRFYRGVLLRQKGTAMMLEPAAPEDAVACFEQGLAFAQSGGIHMHALGCVLALAEVRHGQGRGGEVSDQLRTAIDAISSSEDFAILSRAEALMAAIAG